MSTFTTRETYTNRAAGAVEFMNRTGGPAKGDTISVETLTADEVRAVDLGKVRLHYNDLETAA